MTFVPKDELCEGTSLLSVESDLELGPSGAPSEATSRNRRGLRYALRGLGVAALAACALGTL
eukprot:CAMPEP_0203950232 /NCGR_PEP_ID=MMETSP0359-20131031/84420_1 /ASSEMBLY_ACC=CAM_ASM_000338 /TAXON_ID=268821 /ORGANISM="Scrippsiella Hangoei, Strain SHTV-5" /LENGTH=61 /DNA_ID=CAMNT_0050882385 /DNA_START=33 /DNA_END=214 /DNA_ORIENTATION=+